MGTIATVDDTERETPQEVERVQQWLADKWGEEKPCPYCGNTSWFVDGRMAAIRAYPVICSNCAHVVLLASQMVDGKELDDES